MDPRPPSRPGNPVAWILGLLLIVGIVAAALPSYLSSHRAENGRHAKAAFKALLAAQWDFRENDRDRNGVRDFWTADVAGLAKLGSLPADIGSADPSSPGARPYHGYWFAVVGVDDQDFCAFCAYPASTSSGRLAYYVNSTWPTLFQEPYEGTPRRRWPPDLEMKAAFTPTE